MNDEPEETGQDVANCPVQKKRRILDRRAHE
jgi:hypothetical protein